MFSLCFGCFPTLYPTELIKEYCQIVDVIVYSTNHTEGGININTHLSPFIQYIPPATRISNKQVFFCFEQVVIIGNVSVIIIHFFSLLLSVHFKEIRKQICVILLKREKLFLLKFYMNSKHSGFLI